MSRRRTRSATVTARDIAVENDIEPDDVEIGCDICGEYVAVAPGVDGWKTQAQQGPRDEPGREQIGYFMLCEPCKSSWELGNYRDLYERTFDWSRVDDLAQLAGDTIRISDRDRDEGFGYEL
jgi:hypothetical protein